MKTYIVALTTSLLVSLPDSAKAQGNLVSNGGFDTNAAGWTLANGASYGGGSVLLDNPDPSPSTDPTVNQTINSLSPAASYIVSGDYQKQKDRGGGSPTDYSFGVAIDGIFLFEATSSTNIDLTWYSFNFLYTATYSSALLSLSSQINGTGVSYAIDNIAMQVVPEPTSLWLMGVGGIATAMFFRKRRRTDPQP